MIYIHVLIIRVVDQEKREHKEDNSELFKNPARNKDQWAYHEKFRGWADWLGTDNTSPSYIKFRSFEESLKFVRSLGIKNRAEWIEYCRSGEKPPDIPAIPHRIYNEVWKGWGNWLGTHLPKQKLTLTINKDVIERAKKVGLNISELTERTLDVLTYDLKNTEPPTRVQIASAYSSLFNYTKSLLKKYNITIVVGSKDTHSPSDSLLLLDGEKGLLVVEKGDNEIRNPIHVSDAVNFLFKPTVILENLLLEIIECEEKNEEKMTELQFAIRFLKALINGK